METIPLAHALGVEVLGVDLANLNEAEIQAITKAWHEHLVLLFRDQSASDPDFLQFSSNFGELDRAPITVNGPPHRPELPIWR